MRFYLLMLMWIERNGDWECLTIIFCFPLKRSSSVSCIKMLAFFFARLNSLFEIYTAYLIKASGILI